MDVITNFELYGFLLVLVSAMASSFVAILAKLAYAEGLTTNQILFWRLGIAATIMLTWFFLRVRKMPSLTVTAVALLMGMSGWAMSAICFFNSVKFVPAAVSSVLLYTFPAMVVLLFWLFDRKPPGLWRVVALAVSFLGCVLVSYPGEVAPLNFEGVIYGLGSGFFYASFLVVSRFALKNTDPAVVSTLILLGAASVLVTVSLANEGSIMISGPRALGIVFSLAVIGTVFPVVTMLAGVRRIGATKASIISTFEPLATIGLSALILGELLSSTQILGACLIVLSLTILAVCNK